MENNICNGCGIINYDKIANVDMNHAQSYMVMTMQESLLKGIIKISDVKEFFDNNKSK